MLNSLTFHRFRRPLTLFALLFFGVHGYAQLAPVNDSPCTALDLFPISAGTVLTTTVGNHLANSDTLVGGVNCLLPDHSVYFAYHIPDGYTNIQIGVVPDGAFSYSISLHPIELCTDPTAIFDTTGKCSEFPGDSLKASLKDNCIAPGSTVLIRIAGDEGNYNLRIRNEAPTCDDGCLNGNEITTDVIPEPGITTSTGTTALCPGNSIRLYADTGYVSYVWSTGDTIPTIAVEASGTYSITATDEFGCTSTSSIVITDDGNCVFPGETNNDGQVNTHDLLPIGLVYGTSGPIRSVVFPIPVDDSFIGQPATSWAANMPGIYSGTGSEHADANGDGIVNAADVMEIEDHYGRSILMRTGFEESGGPGDPPLWLEFSDENPVIGDTLTIDVFLGDALNPLSNLYGYAFKINFDQSMVDTGSLWVDFSDTWLAIDTSQQLSMAEYEPSLGFVDLSYTRTDHNSVSGYGHILSIEVIIIDNLGGRMEKLFPLAFDITDDLYLDEGGAKIDVYSIGDTINISQFCDSKGLSTAAEWIEGVAFGNKYFLTGDNGGFMDTVINSYQFNAGSTYKIRTMPGFAASSQNEHWRMWMDLNADGDFEDAGELIDERVTSGGFTKYVTIPLSASEGWTTFRVQMKHSDGFAPQPCEDFAAGEVEDYIIEVVNSSARTTMEFSENQSTGKTSLYPNPNGGQKLKLKNIELAAGSDIAFSILNSEGVVIYRVFTNSNEFAGDYELELPHMENGLYWLHIRSSEYVNTLSFAVMRLQPICHQKVI